MLAETTLRVMVVEDEAVVALLLSSYLTKWGYDVTGIADNFDEAVEMFDSAHPDLVLMDISIMGSRDGIETAQALRDRRRDLPIIFISAFSDQGTARRVEESGAYAFLPKPFDAASLERKVREVLTRSNATLGVH